MTIELKKNLKNNHNSFKDKMQKGANREQYFVCGISLYKTASLMVSLQNRTSKTSVPLNIDVNKSICKMIILGLNVLPHNFMQSNLSTSRELSSKNHVQTACEFHCLNMVLVVRFVVLCHSQKLHGHVKSVNLTTLSLGRLPKL